MIIMALDHTRDYFHLDSFAFSPTNLEQTTAPIFLTRWITHFCAPVFVFLAGTSAFIVQKKKGKEYASRFLLSRGLWLIFLEITLVSLAWSFALQLGSGFLQVIWAIGFSMVVLSIVSRLPYAVILTLGLVIVFGHNFLDPVEISGQSWKAQLWGAIHDGGVLTAGSSTYYVAYPVLPWTGLMLLGFCFGRLYTDEKLAAVRKRWLLGLGFGAFALFLVLRIVNGYGNPEDWVAQENMLFNVLAILNVEKYPPSLHYALMTLGPAFIFLAITEDLKGKVAEVLLVFGRVPLFYYILHLYLIHALAMVNIALFFPDHDWRDMMIYSWGDFRNAMQGYGFGLVGTYLTTAFIVLLLYPLCKWYGAYKARHPEQWWLSYL